MGEINKNTHTGPSFTLANRMSRVIWNTVYYIFFRYSLVPFHSWRSFLLRLFGAKIGKHVHVYPSARIWAPWQLEIEDQSGIAPGVRVYNQGKISIGKRVVVSQGTYLCAGTHDYNKKGFPLITGPIEIKDDVWIAAEAFVHPGVVIGEGAVVGARSVVVSDLPSWTVCSGFPCKPLKERKIIEQ